MLEVFLIVVILILLYNSTLCEGFSLDPKQNSTYSTDYNDVDYADDYNSIGPVYVS